MGAKEGQGRRERGSKEVKGKRPVGGVFFFSVYFQTGIETLSFHSSLRGVFLVHEYRLWRD